MAGALADIVGARLLADKHVPVCSVLAFGMIAGVVADRFPKRNILVLTQSLMAMLSAILCFLVATNRIRLWEVFALALALGIVNSFDMPTRQAFVVEMVGREDLTSAIALNSSLFNAARIVGPSLAGLVLATKGAAWCFGINATSFAAVIIGLILMRVPPPLPRRGVSGFTQLREGLSYTRSSTAVLMPIVLITLVAMFGMNFNVWIPLLAKQDFAVGAGGFGVLMTVLGAGALAGALYLTFGARGPKPKQIVITSLILAVSELVLAVGANLPGRMLVAYLALPVMGFGMTSTAAMANTVVQTASPEDMRGRVMAVYMTFFTGTSPIGAFLVGAMADAWGTPVSIAIGGTITLVAAFATAYWFGLFEHGPSRRRAIVPADSARLSVTRSGRD